MRRNLEKYQKRRRIREEWEKRLDAAKISGIDYGRIVTEYTLVRDKIRRHYPWLFKFTGRMC